MQNEESLKEIIKQNGGCTGIPCPDCYFWKSGCNLRTHGRIDVMKLSKKILRELKLERICQKSKDNN